MKMIFYLSVMAFLTIGLLTGCQTPPVNSAAKKMAAQSTRNNGYSLLHQLLDQEKNVALLRFIRPEEADVKQLMKKIAATSGAGSSLLEKFAQDDPTIRLDDVRLPPAEVATREAIGATKKNELLSQSGDTFELTLLLTQAEALNYGWHLAEVTSQNEPQAEHARALAGLGQDMQNLYHEVFALMLLNQETTANVAGKPQAN